MSPALRVALVGERFRRGTVAEVVVARQSRRLDEMRRRRPVRVVTIDRRERGAEPIAIAGLLVDAEDHLGQKGRLRTGEKVGPVGIEDHAVVRDLVEEVVGHVARELQFAVAKQTELDEIAVPAVHLVEAPARHDVRIREVEEPVIANLVGPRRQRSQLDLPERVGRQGLAQLLFDSGSILVSREVHGRWPGTVHLGIGRCLRQIARRSRQRVPGLLDVAANRVDLRCGRERSRLSRAGEDECERQSEPAL